VQGSKARRVMPRVRGLWKEDGRVPASVGAHGMQERLLRC